MDELDLLRAFRGDVPEADATWIRTARVALIEHGVGETVAPAGSSGPRRSWPGRWWVPAAAAGALAILVALPAVLPAGGPGGAEPAAAATLRRFADIAAATEAERPPGPGQFVFTRTQQLTMYLFTPGKDLAPFSFVESGVEERWLGTDGSGRAVFTVGRPTFPTDGDRSAYEGYVSAGGDPGWEFDWGKRFDDRYAPGELEFLDLTALPTDPEALRAVIEEREILGGPPGDWETFVLAGDLLRVSYAPPALRAALYEVMAGLPGVELRGRVVDGAGREGIALASTHEGLEEEILFDPQTAEVLAYRIVRVDPIDPGELAGYLNNPGPTMIAFAGVDPGTVMHETVYLETGEVVDSLTEAA